MQRSTDARTRQTIVSNEPFFAQTDVNHTEALSAHPLISQPLDSPDLVESEKTVKSGDLKVDSCQAPSAFLNPRKMVETSVLPNAETVSAQPVDKELYFF